MKGTKWISCFLVAFICFTEARYKMRRPFPPPQMFKKSWPIGHRISVGNTVHIGGNFPHKRISHKTPILAHRIRRPGPMFNVAPNTWKKQLPMLGPITPLNHRAVLPQRAPVKEFHTVTKVSEYSPEYHHESAALPPTHRGGMDDDKGPIHTIPAPNLSPSDKPYTPGGHSQYNHSEQPPVQRQYSNDGNLNVQNSLPPNFGLVTTGTSVAPTPQRTVTINPTSPVQNDYEVTESNDITQKIDYQTVIPAFVAPEIDVSRLAAVPILNPDLQTNDVFLNHPAASSTGLIGTNIQFGQANVPMQTNLHSSLHVGFPGTAAQAPYAIGHQIPDLHVGHPAPAGPPLSATQLYDLLNSFPQNIAEQYVTGPQPQLQQHLLQQQLDQLLQPTGAASFSQPQMQSFNYDEQANKQQQQLIINQNYVPDKIPQGYNLESTVDSQPTNDVQQTEGVAYIPDAIDPPENNIEYEETNHKSQTTYFNKVANNAGGISTQFYSTLPNREAAEKLAALAAAGNVNSHLIGHLRKQQQQQQKNNQNGEYFPPNHKDEGYHVHDEANEDASSDYQQEQQSQLEQQQQEQLEDQRQQDQYRLQQVRQQQIRRRKEENIKYEQQRLRQQQWRQQQERHSEQSIKDDKEPLRIMVPDDEYMDEEPDQQQNIATENGSVKYEYENDEADANSSIYEQAPSTEFGSRLRTKNGN